MQSKNFIFEKELAWEPAGEGVMRQILGYDGHITMVKVKFEKGAKGAPHRHYHSQTTYIVSGRFRFSIDGETQEVGPGDGLYMAPDILHGCECLEEGLLIDCFTPVRADFLGL